MESAFVPPAAPAPIELRGRRLRVFVKVSKLHLTPQQPERAAEAWHVDGLASDRIVATAVVVLEAPNVSDSLVSFRRAISRKAILERCASRKAARDVFGLDNEYACCQRAGSVTCTPGLVVAYPNTMQV